MPAYSRLPGLRRIRRSWGLLPDRERLGPRGLTYEDRAAQRTTLSSGVERPGRQRVAEDYDSLLTKIGDRRIVLIGEASHGTHEFYRERARITRRSHRRTRLHGRRWSKADWPDAYRVNRYVMGMSADPNAEAALEGFRRFPTWMWRNQDVLGFVQWLRARNDAQFHPASRPGSTDLTSTVCEPRSRRSSRTSTGSIRQRPKGTRRYSCFDHVGAEGQAYGYAVVYQGATPCENEVVAQLVELRRRAELYLRRDGWVAEDEQFYAEQNRSLVRDAEEYYHQMYRAEVSSWNLRDQHMAAPWTRSSRISTASRAHQGGRLGTQLPCR